MSTADRVELADAEREALHIQVFPDWPKMYSDELAAAVESIVAARVAALTAERDRLCVDTNINADEVERQRGLLDLARAELAAANARCADYENGISWGTSCISCAKTLDSSYAEYVRAERLQATLDRVTALADEWTTPIANWLRSAYNVQDDSPTAEDVSNERLAAARRMTKMRDDLRAALTPEGKPR